MELDNQQIEELVKIADSYISLSELAEKLQNDYQEISKKFETQSRQLEEVNIQLTETLASNSQLSVYLNNILECLNAGIVVFGVDGRINLFNKAAERLTGITRDNAYNENYLDVFPGEEHRLTFDLLEGTDAKIRGEKWYGSQPVGYSANRIFDSDGNFYGVVEILHDISAEKKLRETIRHVSALAALGEMIATVAHQVRNPLAGIIGFSELLVRDFPEGHPSADISKKIYKGAKELNKIIVNLMEFTKKTEPEFREIELLKFMDDVVEKLMHEPFIGKVKIELHSDIKQHEYRFDPILMRQAFVNIAHNACQAMSPDEGILTITVEENNQNFLVIKFHDTGKGFPDKDCEKLFKPFYTTRADGTGLGLSMVKKVVDFHSGAVFAENQENGGAVFTIELPL